jgi:hypothetical protein
MMKTLKKESELAVKQGIESVRVTTHENVVAAANIVNAHLKAVEKEIKTNKDYALELGVAAAKDYASIAAKEFEKLRIIDNPEAGQNTSVRHNTNVNIVNILKEIEASDIVNSQTVFEMTPEMLGQEPGQEETAVVVLDTEVESAGE